MREHASEREKLDITATYYAYVLGDMATAVGTYQEGIANYPGNDSEYGNFGVVYAAQGQYEKALKVTRQAVLLAPDTVSWRENVANFALALQRFDEAHLVLSETQERKLDGYVLHNAIYGLAFLEADSATMTEQQQ